MTNQKSSRDKILFLTQFSMLLAIEAIVCFTPLGSLPAIGPVVATLGMVPVIITAIILGTAAGTAMGFFTGLFSFIVWTFTPPSPIIAFVFTPAYTPGNFWSIIICFVPRILVGTVAGSVFKLLSRIIRNPKNLLAYGISGVLGSLVNTFLVLGGIVLFFGNTYAGACGVSFKAMLLLAGGTVLTSGIPEAIVGGVAACAVCYPVRKYLRKM